VRINNPSGGFNDYRGNEEDIARRQRQQRVHTERLALRGVQGRDRRHGWQCPNQGYGTSVLNLTGVNTKGGATTNVNGVGHVSPYPWAPAADTVYVTTPSGTAVLAARHNDFMGERRISTLRPSGVGTYAQWTPNTGAICGRLMTHPDADTTYVAGAMPTCSIVTPSSTLPANAETVGGVQFIHSAAKTIRRRGPSRPIRSTARAKPPAPQAPISARRIPGALDRKRTVSSHRLALDRL